MDIPTEPAGSVNRRQCVRFSLPGGAEAVLSDGASTRKVTCTDQSAEGFGLLCEHSIPWSVGQSLLLNSGGHWYEVQVMNIREQDGKEQVGLRRIRDCVDHGESSMLQTVLRVFRGACGLKYASSLQILGVCSGFLLCITVLVIALLPGGLNGVSNRFMSSLSSDAEAEGGDAAVEPAALTARATAPPPSQTEVPPPPAPHPNEDNPVRQRIQSVMSEKQVMTWADMEGVLELSEDQSGQLLSLIRGNPDQEAVGSFDTTKIIIESGKDFAAFVKTLPQQAFSFLTEQQRQDLQVMLDVIAQL